VPLDDDLREYYKRLGNQLAPMTSKDAEARRERLRATTALLNDSRPTEVDVTPLSLCLKGRELAARQYRPRGVAQPALAVFFHGGGWVVGDLDTHDLVAARLADALRCAVVSVDYRRAPEHPFPAPCDDARDAIEWLAEHRNRLGFATNDLAVIGDSAGAYLAARASIELNARVPGLVTAQLLLYPMVEPNFERASYAANFGSPGITADDIRFYWNSFLAGEAPHGDVRASLLDNAQHAAAPTTLVVVAEFDPLHDEGRDYAAALERGGARVELIRADGMTHGFIRLQRVSAAARRWAEVVTSRFGTLWTRS
jgi:acetyl esterase